MNVLALGGSGDMGRMAVAILLESPKIDSITVADKNYERANHLVDLTDSEKLSAVEIDVTEKNKLTGLISSHDIVINTVGPYYRFASIILEAVIKARKPYVDICDDWKPTLDLLKMDDKAKKAEVTALVGMGSSPGITNLMAVIASAKLDDVDDLITAWGYSAGEGRGKKPQYFIEPRQFYQKFKDLPVIANAAIMHLFYETLEEIPTYRDGKFVDIKPLTDADPLQFPGFEDTYVCHIGHPEPVTLPRVIKANSVSNLMYLGKTATEVIRKYTQQISKNELTISEATIQFDKESRAMLKNPELIKEYIGMPPGLSVIATGKKDGKQMKVAIGNNRVPFGGMAGVTSVPIAIVADMIINGEITEKGVLTPEEAISDPMEFFNRYAKYCGKNLKGKDVLLIREVQL
ncbi:MAG: saccharopine dehydrogenase NADP-binding domain-containing protein [Candidatus Bathyarchaeota archaeon]|jgi:saccharopine dehydrogenase-like NADP-dependent oxidoreductase|nr:saccharopine dehydrogenase NADP-binding domain-containing protein [Candidatus Bathyarchaeota archaeon]